MFLWKINASIEPRWGFPTLTHLIQQLSTFTSSICHMTWNNESIRVRQYFTNFYPASCIRRSVARHGDYFLHNSQCTLYCSAIIMLVQFRTLHNQLQHMYKAPERFQPTNASWWSFSHIYKLSTSEIALSSILSSSFPSWSGNYSSLSSSVTLIVSDSSPSDSAVIFIVVFFESCNYVASIVVKKSKQFITWSFPFSNNPLK